MFFPLGNYKLHIDQVQLSQLDAKEYAKSMTGALAVLHWHTKVDGMDRSRPQERCRYSELMCYDIKIIMWFLFKTDWSLMKPKLKTIHLCMLKL